MLFKHSKMHLITKCLILNKITYKIPIILSTQIREMGSKDSSLPRPLRQQPGKIPVIVSTQIREMGCKGKSVPRLVRQQPGKVVMGFIPVGWATFFNPKTGVTGFYTFLVTYGTFLISKEYYVMEHEYYGGLSMAIIWYLVVKKIGPGFAKFLDKEIDIYEAAWNAGRVNAKKNLEEQINDEKHGQWSMDGQLLLMAARRDSLGIQLEGEYRKRLYTAYKETVQRLDYQLRLATINDHFVHIHMVKWIIKQVKKAVTPDFEVQYMSRCFDDLTTLAATTKK